MSSLVVTDSTAWLNNMLSPIEREALVDKVDASSFLKYDADETGDEIKLKGESEAKYSFYTAEEKLHDCPRMSYMTGPPSDSAGNRRPNGGLQMRHIRRDNRDRNPRGNPLRDSQTNHGQRNSFGGQGRPDDCTDPQLSTFVPCSTLRHNDSQLPNMTHGGGRIGDLNA